MCDASREKVRRPHASASLLLDVAVECVVAHACADNKMAFLVICSQTVVSFCSWLKEVRQRTGFAAWGGGPLPPRTPLLSPRTPSRSQRTRRYVYVLPQYSQTVLSIAFRLRINILLYISYITCSFFFHF